MEPTIFPCHRFFQKVEALFYCSFAQPDGLLVNRGELLVLTRHLSVTVRQTVMTEVTKRPDMPVAQGPLLLNVQKTVQVFICNNSN